MVGAACVGWSAASQGVGPQEAVDYVVDNFIVKRTKVDSPPLAQSSQCPALGYASLYQEDAQDAQLYRQVKLSIEEFQEFDPDNPFTWVNAGMEVGSGEQAKKISTMLRHALSDLPCYSVQYPATPVNSTVEGSCVVTTTGNRFMAEALFMPPTTEESLVYYSQVLDKVSQLHQQALAQCDQSQYDYAAQCFSLLASNMVYSYAGDGGPWYANNVYGALLGQESECMGMSCAFKALLDCEGIPCFIAEGQPEDSANGHAWVSVYMDGAWYVCDLARCVGDVVKTDPWGNTSTVKWQIGDVPDLSSDAKAALAGFMVPQDDYLSGASIRDYLGTVYTFGGSIQMDDESYVVERAFEAALS